MKKLSFIFQLALAIWLCVCPVGAEFYYEPTVLILPAPSGRSTTAVKITNPMGRSTRIQLSLSEWEIDKNNRMIFKPFNENDPDSIINYVKLSPRQITLGPKQQKVVRIATNLPASFADREYKLTLNMLELEAERKNIETGDKSRKFGLVVNKEVKASTYIWKGQAKDLKSNLEIKSISAKKTNVNKLLTSSFTLEYKLTYENTGNIHDQRTVGIRLFDAETGSLVQEIGKIGIMIGYPTKSNEPITFESAYSLPKELDAKKTYDVEFILVPRFPHKVEATDPMQRRSVVKSNRIRID